MTHTPNFLNPPLHKPEGGVPGSRSDAGRVSACWRAAVRTAVLVSVVTGGCAALQGVPPLCIEQRSETIEAGQPVKSQVQSSCVGPKP